MRLLSGLAILMLFAISFGCGGINKSKAENYRKHYSIEVVGIYDSAIPDGFSEGAIAKVSNAIFNQVVSGLTKKGLTKNDNKNRFKVKYSISYLARKWKGWRETYIIAYTIQLIDENSGNIIASKKDEEDDDELPEAIESVSEDIVDFVIDNIN